MTEAQYQAKLIKRIKRLFPGCEVLKNDANYQQGFPDLTILLDRMWAVLEVKAHADADFQPNQKYFIEKLSEMSFSAVIYPEIEEDVLGALQEAFSSRRRAFVS